MAYKAYIFDVQELGDTLEEINAIDEKILNSFYVSDSQQVVLICEGTPDMMKRKIANILGRPE